MPSTSSPDAVSLLFLCCYSFNRRSIQAQVCFKSVVSISFSKFYGDYLERIVIYFYELASEARVVPDNLHIHGPVTWLETVELWLALCWITVGGQTQSSNTTLVYKLPTTPNMNQQQIKTRTMLCRTKNHIIDWLLLNVLSSCSCCSQPQVIMTEIKHW